MTSAMVSGNVIIVDKFDFDNVFVSPLARKHKLARELLRLFTQAPKCDSLFWFNLFLIVLFRAEQKAMDCFTQRNPPPTVVIVSKWLVWVDFAVCLLLLGDLILNFAST